LFAHIYIGVIFRAHPVRGESHIQRNASGEVSTLAFDNSGNSSLALTRALFKPFLLNSRAQGVSGKNEQST